MDNNKIGKFILNTRKEKNLTQKELGDKLFVTDKAVSKWERGVSLPDITMLNKLSKILGVSVNDILDGTKESNRKIDVNKEIENIPKVLCDKHAGKMHIFAQSTEKTFNENVKLNFDEKHLNFVDEIVKKTAKVCKVEDTDLYNEILFLKENLYKNISDEYSDIIKRAIEIIEKESDDGGIKCSFSHGDFTPWNIYYRDNQMQAFDFEYSSYNMPAYIDIYHYLTQLSLLGYNSGVKKAISIYEKYKPMIEQKDECCDFSYICYLVHILAFYFMRTDYVKDINDINFSGERIGVLRYLLENTSQIHKD